MKFLNRTKHKKLRLSMDNIKCIMWYINAVFTMHADYKSHTGATMTFGEGAVQSISQKQKLNTRSSTKAELVAADDATVKILWTKLFLEEQGYTVEKNTLYQDNKSAILLEENGWKSSEKRTQALNVRYFFLMDQVEKGNLTITCCPTDAMIRDFMSKPLQGSKFQQFSDDIMGLEPGK